MRRVLWLACEKRQTIAFDAKIDGAALPKRRVQAALDRFQALCDARVIALIKAHGADQHLKRSQKMPNEEIDAAGSGRRRARDLRCRQMRERRHRRARDVRRRSRWRNCVCQCL